MSWKDWKPKHPYMRPEGFSEWKRVLPCQLTGFAVFWGIYEWLS